MLTAAGAGVRVTAGEPIVLATSPPGENRWGFYQFPDMWRSPAGEIYVAINVGCDADIGRHDPSLFYVSRDNGTSWRQVPLEEVDQSPDVYTFSDGSQVSFGPSTYIYHVHTYGHVQDWQWWYVPDLGGIDPLPGPRVPDSYGHSEYVVYRYPDIPAQLKPLPMAWRPSADAPWEQGACTLDDPALLLCCLAQVQWYDEEGNEIVEPQMKRVLRPWPRDLVVLPDDTLLWANCSIHPDYLQKDILYHCVSLYASTDRGRTWHKRGMVANDTELTTDGYSGNEHSLQRMANGDLYCVMRTEMGDSPDITRYLAAARSTDNGYTWSVPEENAPFCVTPHLRVLANGTAGVVYGRPGVYMRATGDSGHTWTEALPIVGPPEAELLADKWWAVPYDATSADKISCGNLGAAVTGPDRFILAYSDFHHRNEHGEQCKAVMVREFVVEMDG